jgi:hypothetical protein
MSSRCRFETWALKLFSAVFTTIVFLTTESFGQSGLHTYDAQKLQSVQGIQAALTNASIDQVVITVRSNLDYLSAKELGIVAKETKLVRDLAVFAMLTTTNNAVDYLDGHLIEPRLMEILGDTNLVDTAAADVSLYRQLNRDAAREIRNFTGASSQSPPVFSLNNDYPKTLAPAYTNKLDQDDAYVTQDAFSKLKVIYAKKKDLCNKYSAANGLLGQTLIQLNALEENEAEQQTNAQSTTKELSSATAAYTNAINTNASAQTLATNLAGIFETVTNALAKGEPMATKIGLEIQYNAVNAVISAAASGTISNNFISSSNADLNIAVQVASHLPGLIKSVSDIRGYVKSVPISGLLLNKQLLQLQLDEVNQEIALNQNGHTYTLNEIDALILEIESLVKSRQCLIADPSLSAGFKTNSLATLFLDKSLSEAKRAALVAAIINYCSSIQISQQSYYKNQAMLVQLEYDKAAIASQQALLQWESLVQSPISQLLDYYGSGIKSEQVAQTIVNALGLAAIAWRL